MLLWDNKFNATNIPLSPFSSVIISAVNVVTTCLKNRSHGWNKKKLTSYFKQLTKDEIEVEELLATQLSKNSKDGMKTIDEKQNFRMK